jgi:ACS family hexuronate transporter-like MFS transporter
VGGGWISSALLRRGRSVNFARKTAMLVCALCVMPVIFAAGVSEVWVAVLLIGLATAAHQGWSANLFALASDLFPKQAIASVVGVGGMIASLAAMVFSQSAGFILQRTGSYWSLFAIAGCAYLVAWGVIQVLVPRLEPAKFP